MTQTAVILNDWQALYARRLVSPAEGAEQVKPGKEG